MFLEDRPPISKTEIRFAQLTPVSTHSTATPAPSAPTSPPSPFPHKLSNHPAVCVIRPIYRTLIQPHECVRFRPQGHLSFRPTRAFARKQLRNLIRCWLWSGWLHKRWYTPKHISCALYLFKLYVEYVAKWPVYRSI